MKKEAKGQVLPVIFMLLIVVALSLMFTSCSKTNDTYCSINRYANTEGYLFLIEEIDCGCFPKKLDQTNVVTFNGVTYNVVEKYECN